MRLKLSKIAFYWGVIWPFRD